MVNILPDGNCKKTAPYVPLQPSTIKKISSEDVGTLRSASEVPRGPKDIYNSRHCLKEREEGKKYDAMWAVLEKAKHDQKDFVQDC